VTQRRALLEVQAGSRAGDASRIARYQVASALVRQRAALTPAERLMLACDDPVMRGIYATLTGH